MIGSSTDLFDQIDVLYNLLIIVTLSGLKITKDISGMQISFNIWLRRFGSVNMLSKHFLPFAGHLVLPLCSRYE